MVIALAVIGILYGALLAIGQTDMKRLIAYTSISHFGFIVLGIFAMTTQGQSGSTLYMVNHGFSTAALFLIAGFLISRRGSRLIADFGGVQRVAPMLAGTFLVAGLSRLALPGLSSFVSEFLVLVGTFTRYEAAAVIATVGIILAVALHPADVPAHDDRRAQRAHRRSCADLNRREAWVVAPLIARDHRARLLPEAAARRHQPGGRPHHAAGRRRATPSPHAPDRRKEPEVSAVTLAGTRLAADFETPTIEYRALLPMLIVFGVAVRRRARRGVHGPRVAARRSSSCSRSAGLVAAFVAVVVAGRRARERRRRARSPSTARRCSCRARSCCWRSPACSPSPSASLDDGGALRAGRLGDARVASTSGCSPRPASPRPRSSRC